MLVFDFERPCPACGEESKHVCWAERLDDKQPTFSARKAPERIYPRYLECRSCEILYASPALHPDRALEAYRAAPFVAAEESRCAAASYAEGMKRWVLPRLPHRDRIVDIGAGNGDFIEAAKSWDFRERVGLEVSSGAMEAAGGQIRPLLRPLDAIPNDISVATAFQVLEHIPDPAGLLNLVFERLQPGGMLFVVSHNWRSPG